MTITFTLGWWLLVPAAWTALLGWMAWDMRDEVSGLEAPAIMWSLMMLTVLGARFLP